MFDFQISTNNMSRSMDDDFTYLVKIVDENGDQFYMKSSIDERANTILIQLTDLTVGWIGTREILYSISSENFNRTTIP